MTQTKVEAPFVANNAHFKNLFINGDMQIAQRATSASSVNATGFHACDRWGYKTNGSGLVVTMSQDTDVPTGEGFTTSLKFDVTTADTSTASAERVHFGQTIEAQNLQHLASATSSAKKVTLSFWVKSTITGTYAVAIYKGDQTARLVNATYTISSADTWEHKTITFPGDTGGGGIDNDNGSGFQFDWFLIAGTDSTSGGAQTTWANFAAASWAGGHNVNFGSSTDNNYYITGVQLEVGDQATDFEHLPTDIQLQRCQRYYEDIDNAMYPNEHSGATLANYFWKVTKRAAPTLTAGTNAGSLTLNASNTGGGWIYKSSAAFNPVQNLRGDAEI